jgi:hypothetical protein
VHVQQAVLYAAACQPVCHELLQVLKEFNVCWVCHHCWVAPRFKHTVHLSAVSGAKRAERRSTPTVAQ